MSERAWLGGTSVPSSCMRDVYRLRDELERVKRAKEAHPGRLRKLRVNKGVNLGRLEEYADGLVLGFDASDTGTTSSIIVVDHLPATYKSYRPRSRAREGYHGHRRATHVQTPNDRTRRSSSVHDDHVYHVPRAPPNVYISTSRPRPNNGRRQDEQRPKHSRSKSRRTVIHAESSGSRRSHTSTPDSGHDGDDEWNKARMSQRGHHRHSISSDRADRMTSGLGRSASAESSRQSRRHRPSSSHSNETHTRPHSRRSYHSERGGEQEIRGRDTHKRSAQDTTQRDPSSTPRHRPQSRHSHSSSRHTDARQAQQRHEHIAAVEVCPQLASSPYSSQTNNTSSSKARPPPSRHSSRSSDANMSAAPSRDSGYGSLDPEQRSSGASTRRRSSSGSYRKREAPRADGGDRSRPPISLDRAERAVRRAEERSRRAGRGG